MVMPRHALPLLLYSAVSCLAAGIPRPDTIVAPWGEWEIAEAAKGEYELACLDCVVPVGGQYWNVLTTIPVVDSGGMSATFYVEACDGVWSLGFSVNEHKRSYFAMVRCGGGRTTVEVYRQDQGQAREVLGGREIDGEVIGRKRWTNVDLSIDGAAVVLSVERRELARFNDVLPRLPPNTRGGVVTGTGLVRVKSIVAAGAGTGVDLSRAKLVMWHFDKLSERFGSKKLN